MYLASARKVTKPILVVGAGFTGATAARLLAQLGYVVKIIDTADGPGGMARDELDEAGVLAPVHGPHIFHTNSKAVYSFLGRFTDWTPYKHRSLSVVGGNYFPFPVNLNTLNRLFGTALDDVGMRSRLESEKVRLSGKPLNAKEYIESLVGRRVFDAFFDGYIRKFWGMEPEVLVPAVVSRVRPHLDADDSYFRDRWQCVPSEGYTALFDRMLDHPLIETEYRSELPRNKWCKGHYALVYTGPLSEYFKDRLGPLAYRSIRFERTLHRTRSDVLPAPSLNYPGDEAFTRETDIRQITRQRHPATVVVREYPTFQGPAYYPLADRDSLMLADRYRSLARAERGVWFAGRLGRYRYLNMDQSVGNAMALVRRIDRSLTRP